MDSTKDHSLRLQVITIAILCFFLAASIFFPPSDAKRHGRDFQGPNKIIHKNSINHRKLKSLNHFEDNHNSPLMDYFSFSTSKNAYDSPSSLPLPPFNSLPPQPTPPNLPDYSNPPHNANTSPPPASPSPPKRGPSPPKSEDPGPSPSPPQVYLPPLVYPPPPTGATGSSSPPHKKPEYANWCVAKPTVPDPIIQEAMDYACGTGADCKSIQPNGPCYQPNTMLAHASFAFNSYWQNTKVGGGTCDFGGTAMLVTVDPSKF
ncbi:Plasmodesmata callose-binding protein 3 [Senna tora]|uniref:Plasmodesmata callose-binding protein 3 n=1 Tax=Senna tora TaxID=362788 RepID=A0A835C6D6_9FABA|nr:Plasmodesmata callose-binding protein 3 [Senna tora]